LHITEALREDFWEVKALLATKEGRVALTRHDPLLFAMVYFREHITNPADGTQTVCDFHLDLLDYAESWSKPIGKPKEHRACFIAPRQSGKSTWIFLLLPMWAAAHGHRKFVAAFSDSSSQSETHLHTFKAELRNNELLRNDFPELCEPMKVGESSKEMLNNRNQIMQSNGFIFMARGADSAALGMKLGARRPDVLLFDDIEPGESNYSELEARKRKETLISDLFALNAWAVVAIVGTTTMPNSLIDQMRKVEMTRTEYEGDPSLFRESLDPDLRWVVDENISVHYWPVIKEVDGEEVSLWPEVWPLDLLNQDRHTRAFMKNMMNRPVSADGGYWDDDDIDIDQPEFYRHTIVSVDPAVTTKKASDYTGIAVASLGSDGRVYIRHAAQYKLSSDALNETVVGLIEQFGAGIVVVETNQGGDLWRQVFNGIPAKFVSIRQKEKKEVRASQAVDFYKRGQVKHTEHFYIAEEQMLAFPHVAHDDVVDAVVTAVLTFKKYARTNRVGVSTTKYMEV
jgi:predicted phage terminase large subunit-like protein